MQQLNVITFDNPLKAQEFLLAAVRLTEAGALTIDDAVFVAKGADGKARVHQTTDITPAAGALESGAWGLLLGVLVAGPIGALAVGAASAAGGALLGKLIDAGVKEDFVKDIGAHIDAGVTALIILGESHDPDAIRTELERFSGAQLLYSNLPPDARKVVEDALATGELTDDAAEVTTDPVG